MNHGGCAECGAGLGVGQRYCLHCATPVAGAPHDLHALHRAMRPRVAPGAAGVLSDRRVGPARVLGPGLALVVGGLLLGVAIGVSAGPPDRVLADAGRPYTVTLPPGQRAMAVSTEPPDADAAEAPTDDAAVTEARSPGPDPNPVVPESVPEALPALEPAPVAPEEEPLADEPAADEEAPAEPPKPPLFKHVFLITLSELGYADLYGPAAKAPYVRQLVPQGALLSGYRAVSKGSLANGVALVSGLEPNPQTRIDCPVYGDVLPGTIDKKNGQVKGEGCVYPAGALTVADQVVANGLTWRAYAEDQGAATCRRPELGAQDESGTPRSGDAYATFRNPFLYFHSIIDAPVCAEASVDLIALGGDLADPARTPSLSLVLPNRCRDGSQTVCPDGGPRGVEGADAFLREWVPQITASPAFKDGGVLVIVADRPPSGGEAQETGALILSSTARAGSVIPAAYDHYSLLRTVQDGLNLPYLGNAATATSFGADVFRDATGDETATTGG